MWEEQLSRGCEQLSSRAEDDTGSEELEATEEQQLMLEQLTCAAETGSGTRLGSWGRRRQQLKQLMKEEDRSQAAEENWQETVSEVQCSQETAWWQPQCNCSSDTQPQHDLPQLEE